MMNETLKNIFDRRSIRRFEEKALTQDQLETLADVALASPTGMNRQPWQFHFVTDTAAIEAISEAALMTFRQNGSQDVLDRVAARHKSLFYGAPLVVFITTAQDTYAKIDAGIAVSNLAIAAQSMGLGSCIIALAGAAFQGDQAKESAGLIQMPATHEFAISIAIGHPAMTKDAHERHPEKVILI